MNETVISHAIAASILRAAGEGAALNVLGAPYVIKAQAAETGGAFCCIECTVPPGAGAPPHRHTHEDEVFYVLEGEIVFESADAAGPRRLVAGGFFFGPRGRRHAFRNEGTATARVLVLALPGAGLERMFREIDAAGRRNGGAPSMEEIGAITARAGVIMAA